MIGHLFLILPILYKIFGRKIIRKLIPKSIKYCCLYRRILRTLTLIFILMLPNYINRAMVCERISPDTIGVAFIDGTMAGTIARLFSLLIQFIPGINIIFWFIKPIIGIFSWIIGHISAYFIIYNIRSSSTPDDYCRPEFIGNTSLENLLYFSGTILLLADILYFG